MRNIGVSETAMLAGALVFLLAFASLGFTATPVSAALTGAWVEETSMGGPRAQAVILYDTERVVYVMGGANDSDYSNPADDASSYDLDTGSWNSLSPLPVPTRGAAGAVGPDGRVYVFGGESLGVTDAVQIYDPDTDSWDLGTSMPIGVWQGRAALGYNDMIYVIGGYDAYENTDAVQIYDPLLDSWSLGAPMPSARGSGALVSNADGRSFYYLGGSTISWSDGSADFYTYYVSGDYWYSMTDMPVSLASHAGTLAADGNIFVMGGAGDGYNVGPSYDTTYWYNPNDGEWHDGPALPVGVRHAGAFATPEGMVYLFGGNNDTEVMSTVLSLEVAHLDITLLGTPVAQGDYLTLEIMFDFAFADSQNYYVDAYIISDSGTVYSMWEFWVPVLEPAELLLDIQAAMPTGDYTLVVNVDFWPSSFPEESFEVTVTDAYTFEEQLEMLKADMTELMDAQATDIADLEAALDALEDQLSDADGNITDLQAQLDELQNILTELQGSMDDVQISVDKKADNSLLYAVIGLLIVVIVLMILMMIMGRRSGVSPPPPSA